MKEISLLQFLQKNRADKVYFVDISLPEYDGSKYEGVSYEMAMEEMTVIDEKNKVSDFYFIYSFSGKSQEHLKCPHKMKICHNLLNYLSCL